MSKPAFLSDMKSTEIRKSFIKYFKNKGHSIIRSSPVVPIDDPTLLFTNAGMNQFKPYFLGQSEPDNTRVVNSQKCIRVSGKHNDLEEVGVDTFHHTFFEMLGNWSFGDYYKKDAIQWAWDLFTNQWKLDKERLWATVYEEDAEAFELWTEVTDINPKRVIKCGKKDNFWEMGETGPCGPCSEIHYYVGEDKTQQKSSGVNVSDEYWELWNLVFIQNNRLADGTLEELPSKHVDTGAGLERIAAVLQGKSSNYDTDLFLPIIDSLQKIAEVPYDIDPISYRVIGDHIRMLCFSIADGALPSNDGRGYVLRRILRRAARFGRRLGLINPFLFKLVDSVGCIMGDVFPEIVDKKIHIKKVIQSEEESFNHTLDRGLSHFERIISKTKDVICGIDAFKLYDTYGFPLDLTQLMAKEKGFEVDIDGFNDSMSKQKQKAQSAGKFNQVSNKVTWVKVSPGKDSTFLGYDTLESRSVIRSYAKSDNNLLIRLDKTPFYAESGGQIADIGLIKGDKANLQVIDVKKDNESIIHVCKGEIRDFNEQLNCIVDKEHRESVKKNHTATHLMHKALKQVLGEHVNQAGSLVHFEYLRFDLTHFEKIVPNEINKIESLVNKQILKNIELKITIQKFDDAKSAGAEALFGEKYDDDVRVVKVGDFSMELCGGTHVTRTGDIGSFKIIEESSLSSGVRRIVAVTGEKSVEHMQRNTHILQEMQKTLNISSIDLVDRVKVLLKEKKELEKKLKRHSSKDFETDILSGSYKVGSYDCIVKIVAASDLNYLKVLGDKVYNELPNGIAVLFSEGDHKPIAVVVVSKDLNDKGIKANQIAKDVGGFMEGGGGGKPHLATAGGKKNDSIKNAMKDTKNLLKEILNG